MARKKRKKTITKNAERMSPREFRALLQKLLEKYDKYEELEQEEKEIKERENWFAEDLSEITNDLDFDPNKLWGD